MTTKAFILSLSLSFLIAGCAKDGDPNGIDQSQIVGPWKLVSLQTNPWDSDAIDLTDRHVVYKFEKDGVLVVDAGGETDVPHTDGQHTYALNHEKIDGQMRLRLSIDNESWTYSLSDGQMIISMAYVDGSTLTFVRMN